MHLQQLRKAKNIIFSDDTPNEKGTKVFAKKGMDILHTALDKAEHFVFTAVPDYDEAIHASVEAMKQAGVWRLPFPVTTFEFTAAYIESGHKSRDGNELIKLVPPSSSNAKSLIWIIVGMEEALNNQNQFASMKDFGYVRWIFTRANKEDWLTMGGQLIMDDIQHIFDSCMVALHTRGIKRERWCGDHKIPLGLREPSNAYTKVLVRETIASGDGTAVPGSRYRVRLHLRRGHVREQPYGKGRQQVRSVWIAPMLVGYDEEGIINHQGYEVGRMCSL